jgi:hypothetical protein
MDAGKVIARNTNVTTSKEIVKSRRRLFIAATMYMVGRPVLFVLRSCVLMRLVFMSKQSNTAIIVDGINE